MATESKSTKMAWHVWVIGGGIHSGHDTEVEARTRCEQANAAAEEQGVEARYEVKAK